MEDEEEQDLTVFNCADCGRSTLDDPRDYYMVSMEVWNEYGLGTTARRNPEGGWTEDEPSGMLCMDDMERRLGRKLTRDDLHECPLNYLNPYTRSTLMPNLKSVHIIE